MTAPEYAAFASYGNDSLALVQWSAEKGLKNVAVVYSDTGWAAPWWVERVARCEDWVRSLGFTPVRTTSEGMEALVRRKKGWPRQGMQFCTQHLKLEPGCAWLDGVDPVGFVTCLVGVRREESANRANFPEWTECSPNHGGRSLWAPLARVLEPERNALIRRAGFEPLPHRSRECFPCVNENRTGLRELDEQAIARVERVEADLGHTSKGKPCTMFRPYRHMGATGIREIVRWARSERGKFDPDDGTGRGCDSGMCGL